MKCIMIIFAGFSDPYCMMGIIPGSQLLKDKLQERVFTSGENVSSDEENSGTCVHCIQNANDVIDLHAPVSTTFDYIKLIMIF